MSVTGESLRAYLEYLRDLGVHDLYRTSTSADVSVQAELQTLLQSPARFSTAASGATASFPSGVVSQFIRPAVTAMPVKAGLGLDIIITGTAQTTNSASHDDVIEHQITSPHTIIPPVTTSPMPPLSFNQLTPLPVASVQPSQKAPALATLRVEIGDCTRCPLAYAGRHSIVFADGDPGASLMFVGEGPGADEDASGLPFVGKAGQLLNNMIAAMGLKREQVYIANIVMCRPPKNRTPEPVEATTCSPFLLRQIDIVQPKVIVALGSTAATYLLGAKQSLASLRGQWHDVRGAKCAVTYHPAYLLRDPKMKGEAWKDLQRVMVELGLKSPART